MSSAGLGSRFKIGDWVADITDDTISRDGSTLKLEPRAMRLLARLAQARGAVVSQDALLSDVWAGVVVGPASVYQSVSQLRKTLGDTDPVPTYIATVTRKGYRLVASCEAIDPESPPQASPIVAPSTLQRRPRASYVWLGSVAGLLAVIAIAWQPIEDLLTPPSPMPSIAVLPFLDLSVDQKDQPLCDGLTEELSNWLAQLPTLRVVARTSAFAFRGANQDVRKIGAALNSTYILEGSVRRSGSQLRITAQLIDARDGYHLWSASFDRAMDDIIKLQEDIAHEVADNLQLRLLQNTTQRLNARRSGSTKSYQLYLLARYQQQQLTQDANVRAMELYRQSIATDPAFALAYVGLAYSFVEQQHFDKRSSNEIAVDAEPLLATALRLNPSLSDAYAVRGALRVGQLRNDDAKADFTRAAELNPSDSTALTGLGLLYLYNGEPREALRSYSAAVALDPLNAYLHGQRCVSLADLARFEEAESACARSRALQPAGSRPYLISSMLARSVGRLDEAVRWSTLATRYGPQQAELYFYTASRLVDLSLSSRAREVLADGEKNAGNSLTLAIGRLYVAFAYGGKSALQEQLVREHLDEADDPNTLLRLAYFNLLLNQPTDARRYVERALSARAFTPALLVLPWDARTGEVDQLVVATCLLQLGERAEAKSRLDSILAMLDRVARNGLERADTHALRARALALEGRPDEAMQSLRRAEDLGWRESWLAMHQPYFSSLLTRSDFQKLVARIDRVNRSMADTVARATTGN